MGDINWLSIVIATLIPTIVGFIWYNPKVLGTAWMQAVGMTEEDAKKANMAVVFGVSIVMSFLLALFMLNFCNAPAEFQEGEFDTFKHGAFHGAILGFVVAMPVLVTNALFEQRSFKLIAINVSYWIVTLALMGGVVDGMNTWAA